MTGSVCQMRTYSFSRIVQGERWGSDLGFGAYFAKEMAQGVWPLAWVDNGTTVDVTVLELFPLLVSLHVWGDNLRNRKIVFRVDNIVVHIVNLMISKSDRAMTILRAFT